MLVNLPKFTQFEKQIDENTVVIKVNILLINTKGDLIKLINKFNEDIFYKLITNNINESEIPDSFIDILNSLQEILHINESSIIETIFVNNFCVDEKVLITTKTVDEELKQQIIIFEFETTAYNTDSKYYGFINQNKKDDLEKIILENYEKAFNKFMN